MKNKSTILYDYRAEILFGSFLAMLGLFWPGVIVPDARCQYAQALTGVYDDHHPAMMAFVWRMFNEVCPGFGSMYFIQTLFLFLGLFFVLRSAENFIDFKRYPWFSLLVFLLPWWPQVALYAISLQKDNQFAFCYFMISGILAYHTVSRKKLGLPLTALLVTLAVYGTSVKYQARFLAPVLAAWLGALACGSNVIWRKALYSLAVAGTIYAAMFGINRFLVPKSRVSDSWQYVKLFDLAAISIDLNEDLIPAPNKTVNYSFAKLKEKFQPDAIDPYVFPVDAILTKRKARLELDELRAAWRKAILNHPYFYLKHRLTNLSHCLFIRVGYSHVDRILARVVEPGTVCEAWLKKTIDIAGYAFFSQFPIVLLGLVYFIVSLVYWKRSVLARVICGFTLQALGLVGVVAFMSMAGTPRYTFFSIVMIHGSHLFAIGLYREIKKSREGVSPEKVDWR